jgi:hypothetical protein
MLDMQGPSNMENDRMRLEHSAEKNATGFGDAFTLPPYGICFITVVGR